MHELFAEWYRAATITPEDGMLAKRWEGVQQLLSLEADHKIDELIRLFYGLPQGDASFTQQVCSIFQDCDAAFPMRENELEVAILSGVALLELSADKILGDAAVLGVLAAECAGTRAPVGPSEIIRHIEQRYQEKTLNRFSEFRPVKKPSALKLDDAQDAVTEAATTNSFPEFAKAVNASLQLIGDYVNTSLSGVFQSQEL